MCPARSIEFAPQPTNTTGEVRRGRVIAAGLLAQVEGVYSTEAACEVDGPHVEIAHDNAKYTHWVCRQGSDGLWYLFLDNG
jgi:hypothetical protein